MSPFRIFKTISSDFDRPQKFNFQNKKTEMPMNYRSNGSFTLHGTGIGKRWVSILHRVLCTVHTTQGQSLFFIVPILVHVPCTVYEPWHVYNKTTKKIYLLLVSFTVGDGSGSSLVDFWWCNMLDWPTKNKCFSINRLAGNIFHIQNNQLSVPLYNVFAKYEKSMWTTGSAAMLTATMLTGMILDKSVMYKR